ncbi:unnamed protein product [Symbiodinium necroappetens]|uniref:Uncharacterized protein n=1 Tax=Symbiodinium necroappetens TaxID=1628268 RepID=A0A812UPG1_9DINO|nr:unnamed protein product [Symbiodinium necroappetens]
MLLPRLDDAEAAKKKDKDAKPEDDGKPKPVAFGCEDCNWYVCADCHGKKGEKQWQCMLQVDIREGMEVHRDWFNVDHLRLFAEAEDDMDLEDEEEKEDVNLAKKFYPDLIEGQHIKASLSSAGRWGFTQRFMYDAVVSRVQDDGNYDIKFHDQLLGEKNGMPIEELESLLTFEASGLGLDPSRNLFDFRFNSLPRGVLANGNGVELKPAGDSGGSILLIKPTSYLAMPLEGLAPGGAGSGEDHVKYTLTLELKLPVQRSQHPVALFQASWPEVSGAPQLCAVADEYVPVHPAERDYLEEPPAPGTTWNWHLQVGNVILNKSVLRPGRWHDVTMVVNCKEGRAFIYVDGKIVRGDGGEHAVVIGEGAGLTSPEPIASRAHHQLCFVASNPLSRLEHSTVSVQVLCFTQQSKVYSLKVKGTQNRSRIALSCKHKESTRHDHRKARLLMCNRACRTANGNIATCDTADRVGVGGAPGAFVIVAYSPAKTGGPNVYCRTLTPTTCTTACNLNNAPSNRNPRL